MPFGGKGRESVRECLEFMADYTVDHFFTEEDHMPKHEYPEYGEHKLACVELTARVAAFIKTYAQEGVTTELLPTAILVHGNWTRDHIRDMGQLMGRFLPPTPARLDMFPLQALRLEHGDGLQEVGPGGSGLI